MNVFTSLYPALQSRIPLPSYYTPTTFLLCILPFLFPFQSQTQQTHIFLNLSIFSLLLYLCLRWPCYTTGSPSNDYFNNSHFIAMPLWYIDFVLLTRRDELLYLRKRNEKRNDGDGNSKTSPCGQRWSDLKTSSRRLKWSLRLMLPAQRGIGWNWEVRGVSPSPDGKLSKWEHVSKQLRWSAFFYVQSIAALIALGFGHTMIAHPRPEKLFMTVISIVIVSWSGAIWVWDRLSCAYCLVSAIAVGSGVTESWEWPPLMGSLKDAWSVRQMWSSTYHQVCRRLLSQPSLRIARLLGLKKGSLSSSYVQLFLSFSISCLFHQAQMFNVTRTDMGEFVFFMSQPVAIIFEDLIHYSWRKFHLSSKDGRLERLAGYLWTFLWFSFTLRFYIDGLVRARIVEDWVFGSKPLEYGSSAADLWLHVQTT